jgi:dihydroflavonol-4-reductase
LGAKLEGQSVAMMTDMIAGKMPMIPDVAMGMIDVRDVARLHVNALTARGVAGKRFIAACAEPVEMATVASILRSAGYSKVPSRRAPSFLLRFMGLFDREARGMVPFLGQKAVLDNRATFELLDWKPTPMETSFRDMAQALSD